MSEAPDPVSDLSPTELHAKLGVSKGYASDLINRKAKPSLELAVRIEREFGVPAASWVEPSAAAA